MPEYFYHIGLEIFDPEHTSAFKVSRVSSSLRAFIERTNKKGETLGSTGIAQQLIPARLDDQRIDQIFVQAPDMHGIEAGIGTSTANHKTRAYFEEEIVSEEAGTGIIHLYRDIEETPSLHLQIPGTPTVELWNGSASVRSRPSKTVCKPPNDSECTTLAVLAVPSYLTPKDFLAFVGDKTRDAVSHFRMIKTSRLNRYMVLMKFKDGRFARQWHRDWNGKIFNSMEPETCHVVFVKSVEVTTNNVASDVTSTQAVDDSRSNKPLPPPTPTLVELPTCPVCLERMDESTGLLTILCQHVFHCSCFEKWSGGGCPVCRFSHDDFSVAAKPRTKSKKKTVNSAGEYELDEGELQCKDCHTVESLWQCLICGDVGCGRYVGKHAYKHYERTKHTFSLDLETQRVWDYDHDCYVHRIIANGTSANGEKLVELPGRSREGQMTAFEDVDQDFDVAKRENLAFEYTQLLTSQLESQREYFEESLRRAADKATEAAKRAEKALEEVYALSRHNEEMSKHFTVSADEHLQLQRENERSKAEIQKFKSKAQELRAKLAEEQAVAQSVSKNITTHRKELDARDSLIESKDRRIVDLEQQDLTKNVIIEDLQEQNRDLRYRFDMMQQLKALVDRGELDEAELEGATFEVGPRPTVTNSAPSKSTKSKKRTKKKSNVQTVNTQTSNPHVAPGTTALQKPSLNTSITLDKSQLSASHILTEYKFTSSDEAKSAISLLLEKGLIERKEEDGLYEN